MKLQSRIVGNLRLSPSPDQPISCPYLLLVSFQGYGLTETMAGSCIAVPASKGANVGPPLAGVKIRLESVPDMNYDALANPPRGEILISGDTVFQGYYKREDLTKEVLGEFPDQLNVHRPGG